ncbi:DUF3348 family protein [Accumulibacter sp.]|nr:DUF3348 family protein [Accumulibacter sp.]HRF03044.1 DUF3348 family protein [Accumulibacter sp.]
MTQVPPPRPLNVPRLVRLLTELEVADGAVSHQHFSERLGRLINLPDSIALSRVHGRLATMTSEIGKETDATEPTESIVAEFLTVRTKLVESIVNSFSHGAGASWLGFPKVTASTPAEELTSYKRYQQFYANQQREIALRINTLRANVRLAVSGRSSRLARLVVLDSGLDEAFSAPAQKLFAEVPRLLGKRFDDLYQSHLETIAGGEADDDPQLWSQAGGWLAQFSGEMQEALLAELEARLQPVLGLMEALKEEGESV